MSPIPQRPSANQIAADIGVTLPELHSSARRAQHSYVPFVLAIGSKRRVIHSPRRWLKDLQRAIYDRVLADLPVHEAVFSCRGRGVVRGAQQHLNQAYMAILDVKDCFPSTTMRRIRDSFGAHGFKPIEEGLLTRLVSYRGLLPQGPPTSPAVLNLVFAPIDAALSDLAKSHQAVYTRYVDDLCFSGARPVRRLATEAGRVLRQFGYRANPDKYRVWGPNEPHTVTKIVVTGALNVTEEFMDALISEMKHLADRDGPLSKEQVLGRIAWVNQLNPERAAELTEVIRASGIATTLHSIKNSVFTK